MSTHSCRKGLLTAGRFIALAAFLLFSIGPLLWILLFSIGPLLWIITTSLKSTDEIYTFPIKYIPSHPSFESYRKLFSFADFGMYITNSLLVTISGSIGAVFFSMFGGYALSRRKSRRSNKVLLLVLYFTQTVPTFILMVPLYTMVVKFHGTDNLTVLSIIYMVTVLAFCTIMAKSFFDRIPESLEEAAIIDGCTTTQALFRVVMPLVLPGIVAVFSFAFTNIWNELFIAIMFISSSSKMTVPIALNSCSDCLEFIHIEGRNKLGYNERWTCNGSSAYDDHLRGRSEIYCCRSDGWRGQRVVYEIILHEIESWGYKD